MQSFPLRWGHLVILFRRDVRRGLPALVSGREFRPRLLLELHGMASGEKEDADCEAAKEVWGGIHERS